MIAALVLMASALCPPGYAATGPNPPKDCAWVPAPTDMEDQTCGMYGHRHSLDLDEHGHYVVNHEKGEPDIVFDGKCHDEHEKLLKDPDRKVLPVPKEKG